MQNQEGCSEVQVGAGNCGAVGKQTVRQLSVTFSGCLVQWCLPIISIGVYLQVSPGIAWGQFGHLCDLPTAREAVVN